MVKNENCVKILVKMGRNSVIKVKSRNYDIRDQSCRREVSIRSCATKTAWLG